MKVKASRAAFSASSKSHAARSSGIQGTTRTVTRSPGLSSMLWRRASPASSGARSADDAPAFAFALLNHGRLRGAMMGGPTRAGWMPAGDRRCIREPHSFPPIPH